MEQPLLSRSPAFPHHASALDFRQNTARAAIGKTKAVIGRGWADGKKRPGFVPVTNMCAP
jgi:hypothetical protein